MLNESGSFGVTALEHSQLQHRDCVNGVKQATADADDAGGMRGQVETERR